MRRSGRRRRNMAGHELQVVVVHPHRGAGRGDQGSALGEQLVDLAVAVPAVGVVDRRANRVVIQRPHRAVRHSLVVPGHLRGIERDRLERQSVQLERRGRIVGSAGPSDPHSVALAQQTGQQRGPNRPGCRASPDRCAPSAGDSRRRRSRVLSRGDGSSCSSRQCWQGGARRGGQFPRVREGERARGRCRHHDTGLPDRTTPHTLNGRGRCVNRQVLSSGDHHADDTREHQAAGHVLATTVPFAQPHVRDREGDQQFDLTERAYSVPRSAV